MDKRIEQKYQAKIDELHGQIEAKARELSGIEGEVTRSKSLVEAKRKELSEIEAKLSKARKDFEIENGKITNLRKEAQGIGSARQSDASIRERQIKAFKNGKKELLKELAGLSQSLKALRKDKKALETATEYSKLALEVAQEDARALSIEAKEADTKLSELRTKKAEVEDLIRKNGRILTASELNLRTLEHYVKRLQRIYDKQGIKIDLLSQFNIKRDRK